VEENKGRERHDDGLEKQKVDGDPFFILFLEIFINFLLKANKGIQLT